MLRVYKESRAWNIKQEVTSDCVTRSVGSDAPGVFDVSLTRELWGTDMVAQDASFRVCNAHGAGADVHVAYAALPYRIASVQSACDVRIFLCQKDECVLLWPWLQRALQLVSQPSHVRILDDASGDPDVLRTLRRAEELGAEVVYRAPGERPFFDRKNELFGQYVIECRHDVHAVFFALDADDMLVSSRHLPISLWRTLQSPVSYSRCRLNVERELTLDASVFREDVNAIVRAAGGYGIVKYHRLRNVSFAPAYFAKPQEPPKIMVYGGGSLCLRKPDDVHCIGYHRARKACPHRGYTNTVLGIEFHNMPYAMRVERSKMMCLAPGVQDHRDEKYRTHTRYNEGDYEHAQCVMFDEQIAAYSGECAQLVDFAARGVTAAAPAASGRDAAVADSSGGDEWSRCAATLCAQWYICDDADRQKEIEHCVNQNMNSDAFDSIVWFVSKNEVREYGRRREYGLCLPAPDPSASAATHAPGSRSGAKAQTPGTPAGARAPSEEAPAHEVVADACDESLFERYAPEYTRVIRTRGTIVYMEDRLQFRDVVAGGHDVRAGAMCVFANTDIVIDRHNVHRMKRVLYDPAYVSQDVRSKIIMCLSRWNVRAETGQTPRFSLYNRHDSQDVWVWDTGTVFPPTFLDQIADIHVGKPGCDNRMAHEFSTVAFVCNPSKTIVTQHIHTVPYHTYTYDSSSRVPAPYLYLQPGHAARL